MLYAHTGVCLYTERERMPEMRTEGAERGTKQSEIFCISSHNNKNNKTERQSLEQASAKV